MMMILIVLLFCFSCCLCQCPDLDFSPCSCVETGMSTPKTTLDCSNITSESDLINMKALQEGSQLNFYKICIRNNNYLRVLPESVFGRAVATEYHICENPSLEEIKSGALGFNENPKVLNFANNNISFFPFQDMKGYTNLETFIINDNQLEELPDFAFSEVGTDTLRHINLKNNRIRKTGVWAFQGLTVLENIMFQNNGLEELGDHAFHFKRGPRGTLNLKNNNIKEIKHNIFSDGTATSSSFPQKFLRLDKNQIEYLDQAAFETMLSTMVTSGKGKVKIALNPTRCDCRMLWLWEKRDLFKNVFQPGYLCHEVGGLPIHKVDRSHFKDCFNKSQQESQQPPEQKL